MIEAVRSEWFPDRGSLWPAFIAAEMANPFEALRLQEIHLLSLPLNTVEYARTKVLFKGVRRVSNYPRIVLVNTRA